MSVHYKQPVLLIEFEENKAFSLEVCPSRSCLPAMGPTITTMYTDRLGDDQDLCQTFWETAYQDGQHICRV